MTLLAIMLYSIVFGTVRLLYRFSVIYMAFFYFMIGPMFDFLYLVMIYAVFVNRMIGVYDSRKGKGVWKWSYIQRLYYFCYYSDALYTARHFILQLKTSGQAAFLLQ